MEYLDEEIARRIQERKGQERKKEEEEKGGSSASVFSAEMAKKQIADGKLIMKEQAVVIRPVQILEEQLQFDQPIQSPEIQKGDGFYLFRDKQLQVSMEFFLTKENKEEMKEEQFHKYQTNIEGNLKKQGITIRPLEEGTITTDQGKQLWFYEYLIATGLGVIHNRMLFAGTKLGRFVCNLNYLHPNAEFWKPVTEAISQRIFFLEEGEGTGGKR